MGAGDIVFLCILTGLSGAVIATASIAGYHVFSELNPFSKPKQIESEYCYVCDEDVTTNCARWFNTSFKTCMSCHHEIGLEINKALNPYENLEELKIEAPKIPTADEYWGRAATNEVSCSQLDERLTKLIVELKTKIDHTLEST